MGRWEESPYHASEEDLRRYIYGVPQEFGSAAIEDLPIMDRVKKAKEDPVLKSNEFIQNLAGKPGFVSLPWMSPKALDPDADNELYLSFLDLKAYEADPNLYEDLIKMAFYTSGLGSGFGTFHKHIPADWMIDSGYIEFYRQMSDNASSYGGLSHLFNSIARHTWENSKIVPSISHTKVDTLKFQGSPLDKRETFVVDPKSVPAIGNHSYSFPVKRFVKMSFYNAERDTTKWVLYKHEGFMNTKDAEGNTDGRAIYFATNKQGHKRSGVKFLEHNVKTGSLFGENAVALSPLAERLRDIVRTRPGTSSRGTKADVSVDKITPEQKKEAAEDNIICGGKGSQLSLDI